VADPDEVKRALAALAADRPPTGDLTHNPAPCIRRAHHAVEDVSDAARFLDEVGLDALERAVVRAHSRGDRRLARRGQRALDSFERFRQAADGSRHFHPAHGITLTPGTKGDDI